MKVKTRPVSSAKARIGDKSSHRGLDIAGVLLLALSALVAMALAGSNAGLIGGALSGFFSVIFGRGGWVVPVLFALVGVALLRGRRIIGIAPFTIGLTLIFLAILAGLAAPQGDDYFDPATISASGGYLGAIFGWLFATLFGVAKPVAIGALGLVGLILCVDTPIRTMLARAKEVTTQAIPRGAPRPARAVVETAEPVRSSRRSIITPSNEEVSDRLPEPKTKQAPMIKTVNAVPLSSDVEIPKEGYKLPPFALLNPPVVKPKRSEVEMQKNIETLESTLEEFDIDATVVEVATGPTITRYEIQLGPGIKVNRITALADNIAMNLAAYSVRLEAPIPGKTAIGVEVPNTQATMVTLREVCETAEFRDHKSRLCVALGQDVSGVNKYADLTRMPHLLIGGATNSGKSIGLATIITSLLIRNTPKDVRFVMIDPKRVELSLFDHIPHLMCPVIKDVKEAPGVLRAVWREMDRRYDVFSAEGVRNIDGWNEKASFQDRMPYIVVVIDELADLMIQAAAEVETSICRLAQLARATGIHLVIATQRPSVDVITGTIKANIASRIAFTVSSQIDSRTILDAKGAESLIGRGDMLFLPIEANKPLRVQGCYVSEKEIAAICGFWRSQEQPNYELEPADEVADPTKESGDFGGEVDPFWQEAVQFVAERGQASTSMLQRKFSIGFQRASRLLDMMEERRIVGPRDGPRPREVLVSPMDLDSLFGRAPRYDVGRTVDDEEVL